ncbi:LuxR family transcriptional regulator [Pseudonocardiaceae bacterium YIM PH 21723]|nr:LuxR family transcriptional regulator [Pseudonocardiaceae bacterium YIM PH 21723]
MIAGQPTGGPEDPCSPLSGRTDSRQVGGDSVTGASNLPIEVTSFVGRAHEVSSIAQTLRSVRLVTLTGLAGVGKTRLAMRVANDLSREFRDGVWLVELAQLQHGSLLAHTVAQSLGIHDESGRPPLDLLVEYLKQHELLLVLDNCEHMISDCTELVNTLLRRVERLKVLATSREALQAPGEHVWTVEPLSTSAAEMPVPFQGDGGHAPAVRLFAQRGMAATGRFTLNPDNLSQVVKICEQLDGIPLAIELAAAQLPVLSLNEILERLDDRFSLLRTNRGGFVPHHRTLRDTVDWSFRLCHTDEQILWVRCSVFAGSFTLTGAEIVCSGDEVQREKVLELLSALVSKSIMLREEQHGQIRYRMLDTIRHYGWDLLAEGGTAAEIQRRHVQYYLELADQASREWFGPAQLEWIRRLRAEHANLRAALFHCSSHPDVLSIGGRIVTTLATPWIHDGLAAEVRHWLEQLLAELPPNSSQAGRLMAVTALTTSSQGDLEPSRAMASALRQHAATIGDKFALAHALVTSGAVSLIGGDYAEAAGMMIEAVDLLAAFPQSRAVLLRVQAEMAIASCLLRTGNFSKAEDHARQAMALCREHGERTIQACSRMLLAQAVFRQGKPDEAITHVMEALRLRRALPDPLTAVLSVELLASVLATIGDYQQAAVLLGASQQLWRDTNGRGLRFGFISEQRMESERRTREELGEARFTLAFEQGAQLSLSEVVDYCLGGGDALPKTPAKPRPALEYPSYP